MVAFLSALATEKGVELNSFPSHEFFSASFHANFHFACPKAPSLPPPFTPFLPYSASVACATGGETFSLEARSVCREQTWESCAQLPLEQESEPFANSGSRFPSAAAVRPISPYPIGRRATLPSMPHPSGEIIPCPTWGWLESQAALREVGFGYA